MPGVPIRKVPSDLPNASLFIDDLKEIEDVVSSISKGIEDVSSVRFTYKTGDSYLFESLMDLEEHGGSACEFEIEITIDRERSKTSDARSLVAFFRFGQPRLRIPYPFQEREWELYGRIGEIFKARRSAPRDFAHRLSAWVWVVAPLFIAGFWEAVRPNGIHLRPAVFLLLAISSFVLAAKVLVVAFPNRVYFRHRRQSQQERKKLIAERAEKAIWAVVGSGLTLISQYLLGRLRH